uniref:Ycf3-interacting protein 1, chloroplastic n=1 Tax=Kalanchoe fedtschenkoi TaxID=63787 RepID=A0A7N0U157_KALFE
MTTQMHLLRAAPPLTFSPPSTAALPLATSLKSFRNRPLNSRTRRSSDFHLRSGRNGRSVVVVFASSAEDTETRASEVDDDPGPPTPQDLEYVQQIQQVLALLKKNRDMFFGEVKLTIAIEDAREVERRRLLGIDESDGPSREDLAAALEEVNEGKVPRDRVALRMLAEEMTQWPNLEVESKKSKPRKSLYAKATDTGVDPAVAAKRLNIDWDAAAEIEDSEDDSSDVPAAVGYGALYLVTAFPIIIGISVVLILFYNSLQ